MGSKLNILFCVESGILENQAILLIKSINRCFRNIEHQINAYSPRIDSQPSKDTTDYFKKMNVNWCDENLNIKYQGYPISNKVFACNHFEKNNPQQNSILFIDTDTIFLNPIDQFLMSSNSGLYLRPVDNKGPGSESLNDPNDKFWKEIFALTSVKRPSKKVVTTVRQTLIQNYFNAGFIWAHRLNGFFHQWLNDFETIIQSNIRPYGYQSKENNDFRCLDQVALAVTSARYLNELQLLPNTYNYPIPFRPLMSQREDHPKFENLVHIHYHKWFQHKDFINHVTSPIEKESPHYKWLNSHLPLNPLIHDRFKC